LFGETQYKHNTHICMSIYSYEHMHVHHIPMNTSKKLNQFDLEIHKVTKSFRQERRLPLKE
jgi:hypothetical protein